MLAVQMTLTSAPWSVQAAQQLNPPNRQHRVQQLPSPRQLDMPTEAPRPTVGAMQASASRPAMPQNQQVWLYNCWGAAFDSPWTSFTRGGRGLAQRGCVEYHSQCTSPVGYAGTARVWRGFAGRCGLK